MNLVLANLFNYLEVHPSKFNFFISGASKYDTIVLVLSSRNLL